MKNDYGTIEYKDKMLTITQQPYIEGPIDYPIYKALAIDIDGNEYEIIWPIVEINCQDESDVCDWEKYHVKEL